MSFPRRFLSPREVSEYVGCHIMTAYSWIDSGKIPSTRIGRKILVDKRQLDVQLENQPAPVGVGRKRTRR